MAFKVSLFLECWPQPAVIQKHLLRYPVRFTFVKRKPILKTSFNLGARIWRSRSRHFLRLIRWPLFVDTRTCFYFSYHASANSGETANFIAVEQHDAAVQNLKLDRTINNLATSRLASSLKTASGNRERQHQQTSVFWSAYTARWRDPGSAQCEVSSTAPRLGPDNSFNFRHA